MKLIYGRAGTGKTEYIFKDINKKVNEENIKEKIYIITPEQFSFTAEKNLLRTLRNGATTKVEVLSFEGVEVELPWEVVFVEGSAKIVEEILVFVFSLWLIDGFICWHEAKVKIEIPKNK